MSWLYISYNREDNQIQVVDKMEILKTPKQENIIEQNDSLFIQPKEKKPFKTQLMDNLLIEGSHKPDNLIQQIDQLEQDENYEGAFGLCTNALKNDPNNTDLLEKTAMLAKMVGNKEKCIECWEKLLEIMPSNQVAYYELQDLYMETDKFKYYTIFM